MPLYYVTGVSGTGKSTVLLELQNRVIEAHGVDEEGYANWINRETNQIDEFPHGQKDFDIHKWFEDHDWVLDAEKVAKLREQSDISNEPVFLCGGALGEDKAWDSFSAVFALIVDAETVKRRVAERKDNDFGKTPEELDRILYWHEKSEDNYRRFGAILVDATKPVDQVVDEIIANTGQIKIS